jgi:hypothetical protein
MATPQVESSEERFKRYQAAKNRSDLWEEDLERAYKLALPVRDRFDNPTPGDTRTNRIFDTTAVQGVQSFANNIQSIILPPGKRWTNFESGEDVPEDEKQSVDVQLQGINNKIFKYLRSSNFDLVANEALQDMAISTGVILFNEGTIEQPFEFSCAPMSSLAFEPGKNGVIENVWRKWRLTVDQIKKQWPDAVIPNEISNKNGKSPIDLIEGSIHYPNNPIDQQWFYYVQVVSGQKDIISEFMEFSPWIAFRFRVAPGETLGFGPVLLALNAIQTLNKMAEFELKIAQFRAFPPYTAPNTATMNPYTMRLEPGSIIPIEPNFVGQRPIDLLPVSGDANFGQLSVENLQQQINDILFAEPLGPPQGPNATATEVSIRQQNWLRKSTAAFGRMQVELVKPIMDRALRILRKKGLIDPIVINNKEILEVDGANLGIKFESPLSEVQKQEDFQRMETLIQAMQQLIAPQAPIIALDMAQLPLWMAEKLNVDLELVKSAPAIQDRMGELFQANQQQQQQQAVASGQQLPPTPEPPQDQIFNSQPIQGS